MAPVGQRQIAVASLVGTGTNGFPQPLPWGPTWAGIHTSSGIHKDRHIRFPPVAEGGTRAGRVWHKRGWQRAGRSLPDGPRPRLLRTVCIQELRALLETPQPKWEKGIGRDSDSRLHPAAESPPQTHPGTPGVMATPPHTEQRSLLNTFWV